MLSDYSAVTLTSYKQFYMSKTYSKPGWYQNASAETEMKEKKKKSRYFQTNLRTDFFAAPHQNLSTD